MRIVGEIPHSHCKITLFHWNNRYLVKLEQGPFEQTFKIDQFDVNNERELQTILDDTFLKEALDRFDSMATSLRGALQRA